MEEGGESADQGAIKNFNYPCVKHCDMVEEMKVETMEMVVTAVEKFGQHNENAARMIKEAMDKKYGNSWHVVVGEGYGFEVTHEVKHILSLFFGGNIGVTVWKCS
eukprot:Nk52_evm73s914 gene=Nk52_evmTU73s914